MKTNNITINKKKIIIKSNGTKYTVRNYSGRYFSPDEWLEFMNKIKQDKTFIFELLLNTGVRLEEALCINRSDINLDKKYLKVFITHTRHINDKKYLLKPRYISISSSFSKELKKYISTNNLKDGDYLFLDNSRNYDTKEKLKKETKNKKISISQLMKRALAKTTIKDCYNFSLNNIRKTHIMWLNVLHNARDIDINIITLCIRVGEDFNTFKNNYGSADIFERRDRQMMINLLGDIYGLK